MAELFHLFWGKARPHSTAGAPVHPLVAHGLDVGAVSVLLAPPDLGFDGRLLGFLASLHDIGKFSRPFQCQAPAHWPADALGVLDQGNLPPPGPKHDALAMTLLQMDGDLLGCALPLRQDQPGGWTHGDRNRLLRALAGHHGRPVATPDDTRGALCPGCTQSARDFVAAMAEVFGPKPLRPLPGAALVRAEWRLAGLTTLADWIGSRQAWFPYVEAAAVADPARYLWTHALPRAAAAIAAAGLVPVQAAPFEGLRKLFPGVTHPSPVQLWAEQTRLPDGPVLAVIEDLTGSGKTEAALTLAHRLLAAGRGQGVYVALPTMATANAMFDRVAKAYRRFFFDGAPPSLALAHGRAHLDARFAPLPDGGPAPKSEAAGSDPADQAAESQCAAWLAEDRRRALLAHVGVGTIDQALLAVLPVRHAALRLFGLAAKVLVVDEAHAFDPYMRRELVELLRFHAALGGSAILLSATLPHETRSLLVNAFRDGLGAPPMALHDRSYPLATLTGAGAVAEVRCAVREGLGRRVAVTRVASLAMALERVSLATRAGAAVAWIRNTVDDALAAAELLREAGFTPLVFHARFALCDRMAVEAEVLGRFGRRSTKADRGFVLVATQVIEQSLDLDFDFMCTDLAPVDSLIQRAGRLWRHARDGRPLPAAELVVLSPEPVDAPGPGWIKDALPGTAAVYDDPALLWRSARALFALGSLTTPDDMRPLIEAAADGASPGQAPPGLAAGASRAKGKGLAEAGIAGQNVLKYADGYRLDAGAWQPDTQTPTRLENRPQVTLRLGRLRGDRIVPYCGEDGDTRRAWSLSEVTVARHRFASSPVPADAALAAKAHWGRWERESDRFVLAVLEETGVAGEHGLVGLAEDGSEVHCRYSPQQGLRWQAIAE